MSAVATAARRKTPPILLLRILMLVPVFNLFLREAIHGTDNDRLWFAFNLLVLWLIAVVTFGYPAVIIPALCLVGMAFLWLLETVR
ncbi:hypothetical protein [Pannonibacter tanglangensis]|nr:MULTISPECIES: hypothetical protein [unclassified Pannonibacter]